MVVQLVGWVAAVCSGVPVQVAAAVVPRYWRWWQRWQRRHSEWGG